MSVFLVNDKYQSKQGNLERGGGDLGHKRRSDTILAGALIRFDVN